MAKLLFFGTAGMNDPTKATMPFVGVSSALDKGHETALILSGDATLLFTHISQISRVGAS